MSARRAAAPVLRRAARCITLAMAPPIMAAPLATGHWAGAGIRIEVTATAVSIDMACGHGLIPGPVALDDAGRFEAVGRYEVESGGPRRADDPAAGQPARFSGAVEGDLLRLTITPAAGPPQAFELRRGARVKLVRCL